MSQNAGMKQMQLYYFDNELESINTIIYLAGDESLEGQKIVKDGEQLYPRLRLILRDESSENKALYYEKCFQKMNQASVIFKQ